MKNLTLTSIIIYPVKSLEGISVPVSFAGERGLQFDRRWMLVNDENIFISQRECAEMVKIRVRLIEDGFELYHKDEVINKLFIPFSIHNGKALMVMIWKDVCQALHLSAEADEWFSSVLGISCHLVYMHENSRRYVDQNYADENEVVSFADGFPFLIIGEATLENLNLRLEDPVPMNRFRPNFVFNGGEAFDEDHWKRFKIADVTFEGVKLCGRCIITTIDQETAEKNSEPLRTLNKFRKKDNKVLFGQNLIVKEPGEIKVGDILKIEEYLIAEEIL